jgi:GIY-YIG catalytic domain
MPPFSQYPVSRLASVAHLFPPAERCGVYILEFANGERYVGQTVNVAGRFGSHRRAHGDIAYLQFCPCPRSSLTAFEKATIGRQRDAGYKLRNITHALGPLGDSDLDPVVLPAEQHAWLNDPDHSFEDQGDRADDPAQRREHHARYLRLSQEDTFPLVTRIISHYVPACLPKPAETERTFWAISALPGTGRTRHGRRLTTLSVNKMETLFLLDGDGSGRRYFGGVVNVSLQTLTDSAGSLKRLARDHPMLDFREAAYESAGGDALAIGFTGIDGYHGLWDIPGAPHAARALNIMLMRKGPTFQWRSHCYDLADWAFAADDQTGKLRKQTGTPPAVG